MSSGSEFPIPETKVLAIASHVVYGYVGNTVATFVMQSLGAEVAAINTVQFSNHLGYGMTRGTRSSSQEILDLWSGLKQSDIDNFQMLLSGFLPDAESVEAVGIIAESLKISSQTTGGFFWVLDPVMGDNGKLYVSETMVPAYKRIIKNADLLLPNQYEADEVTDERRILSGVQIQNQETILEAISIFHEVYNIPHMLITSVSFSGQNNSRSLAVVGSTRTSSHKPRPFIINVPNISCRFSGCGDMLAALMVVRLREAVHSIPGIMETERWCSPDEVASINLPLAKAAEKALGSMYEILIATKKKWDSEMEKYYREMGDIKVNVEPANLQPINARAAELSLVRNISCLTTPAMLFTAEELQ